MAAHAPHVSAACYHGYERPAPRAAPAAMDLGLEPELEARAGRKRTRAEADAPPGKRPRPEVHKETNKNVEIELRKKAEKASDEYLELLLWQTHGGNMYHLVQCL